MSEETSKITIDAALSPNYNKAFKAAQNASKQLTTALNGITREENDLRKVIAARSAMQAATSAKDQKAFKKAEDAYKKLTDKMRAQGRAVTDVDGRIKQLTARRSELERLQKVMAGRMANFGRAGLAQSINEANKAIDGTQSRLNKVSSMLQKVGKAGAAAFKQVGIGALRSIGSGAMGMIGGVVGDLFQMSGDLKAAAPVTGMSESQYSGLVRELAYMNIGPNEIEQFFQKAADVASGGVRGDTGAIKTLQRIGLNRQSLVGLSQREQVETMLNALTSIGGAQSVELAKDVFGRSGASLVSQLKDNGKTGTDLFRAASARNQSEEELEKLHKAADKMIDMREKIQDVILNIISQIDLNQISEIMDKMIAFFMKVVPILAGPLLEALNLLIEFLNKMLNKGFSDTVSDMAHGTDFVGKGKDREIINNTYSFGSTHLIQQVVAIKEQTDEALNNKIATQVARETKSDLMIGRML